MDSNYMFQDGKYRQYWLDRWERNKPILCTYCNHRLECLNKQELNTIHCTDAWNRMASLNHHGEINE
jgi:hypothetical protein